MRGSSVHYFKSLNRHLLLCGVEQRLFFLILALCIPIAVSAHYLPKMDVVAIGVFSVFYSIGVLLARVDPHIMTLYCRHIHYQKYYAPIAGIHARVKPIKPSVPYYQGKRGLL